MRPCGNSTTAGESLVTWADGKHTVVDYDTTGALAAVVLQGTVGASMTLTLVASSVPAGFTAPPTYVINNDEPAFVVKPVRVEKPKNAAVDLKTWKGAVIVLQPDADVRFASKKSLEGSFRLIAVEAEKGKGDTFLFKKHDELKYVKKK